VLGGGLGEQVGFGDGGAGEIGVGGEEHARQIAGVGGEEGAGCH